MDPEDLINFWLLYQLEPFCTRSEEARLGQAVGAVAGRNWFDIFPGDQGENIPKAEKPEEKEQTKEYVDAVVAHWMLQADVWNRAKG